MYFLPLNLDFRVVASSPMVQSLVWTSTSTYAVNVGVFVCLLFLENKGKRRKAVTPGLHSTKEKSEMATAFGLGKEKRMEELADEARD